ncbi:MAG: Imm17 family immunity protein [Candidatus Promineifilaceae bacterium]
MARLLEGTSWGFIIVVLVGLFTITGGLFNWDWYMTERKARFVVKLLGRTGA